MKKYTVTNKKEFLDALYDILNNSLEGEVFCNVKNLLSVTYLAVPNEGDNDVKGIYYSKKYSYDMIRYPRPFTLAGFYYKGKFVSTQREIFPVELFYKGKETQELLGDNPQIDVVLREFRERVVSFVFSKNPSLEALEKAGLSNVVENVKNMNWDIKTQATVIVQNAASSRMCDEQARHSGVNWWFQDDFPVFLLVKASIGATPWETLIQFILDKYKNCMNTNNVYWEVARQYMYERLLPKIQSTLTEEQKTLMAVVHNIAEKCWKESSYITIRIQGRDELLTKFAKSYFPEFSIEGKEVVIQRPFDSFWYNPLEVGHYDGAKFQPKLKKEGLPCPLIRYIKSYSFEDIISISYRGKKYYQNPRQNVTV